MQVAMKRSPESLHALAEIVRAVRIQAGASTLSENDFAREVRDWSEICAEIPDHRLRECYLVASRDRSVRAIMQPHELIQGWKVTRERERARVAFVSVPQPEGGACYYCEGAGWQTIAYIAESGSENTGVRACACSAAPLEIRKLEPLGEPEWHKRKHSVIWERAE